MNYEALLEQDQRNREEMYEDMYWSMQSEVCPVTPIDLDSRFSPDEEF